MKTNASLEFFVIASLVLSVGCHSGDVGSKKVNASARLSSMTTPAPDTTLSSSSETFSWDPGIGASQYHLSVGTSGPGSKELFDQNMGRQRSNAIVGIPTDGRTIYVRLWSLTSRWLYQDYTYSSCTTCGGTVLAAMSNPRPGTALNGATVTFEWNAGVGATQHHLDVGTGGPGSKDLFSQNTGNQRSRAVGGIPVDGRTIYVRLWSLTSSWLYRDYAYSSCTNCGGANLAAITSPEPGSPIRDPSSVKFHWDAGVGAAQYHLAVGTSGPGSTDLFDQNTGMQRSRLISGIPTDGRRIYVRLWSLTSSWLFRDYDYGTSR